MNISKAL